MLTMALILIEDDQVLWDNEHIDGCSIEFWQHRPPLDGLNNNGQNTILDVLRYGYCELTAYILYGTQK